MAAFGRPGTFKCIHAHQWQHKSHRRRILHFIYQLYANHKLAISTTPTLWKRGRELTRPLLTPPPLGNICAASHWRIFRYQRYAPEQSIDTHRADVCTQHSLQFEE